MARRVWGGRSSLPHNFQDSIPIRNVHNAGAAAGYSAGSSSVWAPTLLCLATSGIHRSERESRSSPPRLCRQGAVIAEGKANILSFITRPRVAQTRTQETHLLIFADGLVVFHNHIEAGGRVQRGSLQVELQHLRQQRADMSADVIRTKPGNNHSQICKLRHASANCEKIRATSFQTGFTSLSITFVFFFSSKREMRGFLIIYIYIT